MRHCILVYIRSVCKNRLHIVSACNRPYLPSVLSLPLKKYHFTAYLSMYIRIICHTYWKPVIIYGASKAPRENTKSWPLPKSLPRSLFSACTQLYATHPSSESILRIPASLLASSQSYPTQQRSHPPRIDLLISHQTFGTWARSELLIPFYIIHRGMFP